MHYWFECTSPSAAPKVDITMIAKLLEYREINGNIANGVLTVLCRHLWYLSETLVGFAFFDRSIDARTKRLMVAALKKKGDDKKCKKASIDVDLVDVSDLRIDKFVTSNTHKFFDTLFASDSNEADLKSFLEIDPSRWINNKNYLRAEEIVGSIKVVNDAAERAVNLITRVNDKGTTIESEKQLYLLAIDEHQKLFPYQATKKDFSTNLQSSQ